MIELYWISILDTICDLSSTAFIISLLVVLFSLAFAFFTQDDRDISDSFRASMKRYRNKFSIILIISSLFVIFVPRTKDAYMIYGIGGTIDYLQSNETAKKLPDKCIKALDKFVGEYSDSIQ